LDEAFVFNSQVLDLVLSELQLNGDLVTLFFSSLEFTDKDVLVDLDLLFSLLHTHLQLVLSVLEAVDTVSLDIDGVSELFNFKLHAVVLDKGLFLGFEDFVEVAVSHFIFQLKLLDLRGKGVSLVLNLVDGALDVTTLILELLVGNSKFLKSLLLFVKLLLNFKDFLLKTLSLFLAALSRSTRNFTLHLLNLELSVIQELLLSLLLLL
jgi:hypothetical protein